MRLLKTIVAALLVALSWTDAASAANVVVNPDFDTNITTAWTSSGTASWDGSLGSPASGSARLTAMYVSSNLTSSLTQCVAVAAPGTFDFSARTHTYSSSGNGIFKAQVTFFAGPACTGTNLGTNATTSSALLPGGGSWFEHSIPNSSLPATSASALVEVYVTSGTVTGGNDFLFDHVQLNATAPGPAIPAIPTLGRWGLILFSGMIALLGALLLNAVRS